MILYILALMNSVMEIFNWTYDKAGKIKAAVESVFRPRYYIFFKGSPFAYDSAEVTTYGTGSREVEYVYSTTDRAFFAWNNTIFSSIHNYANVTHPIPVLSMEVINNETKEVQYDLTDFLEKMSVRAPADKLRNPCVAEILSAWTLHSSIVLDPARFSVRLMDTAARELEARADDGVPLCDDAEDSEDSRSCCDSSEASENAEGCKNDENDENDPWEQKRHAQAEWAEREKEECVNTENAENTEGSEESTTPSSTNSKKED